MPATCRHLRFSANDVGQENIIETWTTAPVLNLLLCPHQSRDNMMATSEESHEARRDAQALELNEAGMNDNGRELDALDISTSDASRQISNRDKAAVLIGCSILQLPIWGKEVCCDLES